MIRRIGSVFKLKPFRLCRGIGRRVAIVALILDVVIIILFINSSSRKDHEAPKSAIEVKSIGDSKLLEETDSTTPHPLTSSTTSSSTTQKAILKSQQREIPKEPKRMLYWGSSFGGWYKGEMECKREDGSMVKCVSTGNRQEYPDVDALIFHAHETPALPDSSIRPQSQVWVYENGEAYPGAFASSPKNHNVINWTMISIYEADVYFGFGETVPGKFKDGFDPNKNYLRGRNKSVATMISNCNPKRLRVVNELAKYIDVDIYGRCGLGRVCFDSEKCFDSFKEYKFYLSFENALCKDYVTEKLFVHGLTHGLVPIVLGGANYTRISPPHSFIDAMSFDSMKALAHFLKDLGSNSAEYNKYFRWYSDYDILPPYQLCPLCVALHKPNIKPKWYENIQQWYGRYGKCSSYPTLGSR